MKSASDIFGSGYCMPGRERNIILERREGKWTETWMVVLDVRFSLGVRKKEEKLI